MKLGVDYQTQNDAEWGLVRTTSRDKPTFEDYIYDLGISFYTIYAHCSHTCDMYQDDYYIYIHTLY